MEYENIKNQILRDAKFLSELKTELGKYYSVWGDQSRIHFGKSVSAVNTLFNTASGEIYLGDYTFTGHNVSIITGSHDINVIGQERENAILSDRDIHIGNGVWIGSNSVILGPCLIEDNAVIAAGTVILPNTLVEANSLYAGVPGKLKKQIRQIDSKLEYLYGFHETESINDEFFGRWGRTELCRIAINGLKKEKEYTLRFMSAIDGITGKLRYCGREEQFSLIKGINEIHISLKLKHDDRVVIEILFDQLWSPKEMMNSADYRQLSAFVICDDELVNI